MTNITKIKNNENYTSMINLIISCIILLFSTNAYNQGLRGGIKVGTNATFMIDNNSSLKNAKERFERGNGYQIGLETSYMIFHKIGILGEVNYQNNEFSFTQNKIVNILPNGENSGDALVKERISVKNGSFNFNVSLLLNFGKFGMSLGSNIGLLTSSKGDVLRSYLQDSMSQEISESLIYDFIKDEAGRDGAYWNQSNSPNQLNSTNHLFDRFNFGTNLAFRFDLFKRLGIEVKTNYGFGDIINDISLTNKNDFGRQLDLLLSVRYTFPIKLKKKSDDDDDDNDDDDDHDDD